MTSVLHFPLLVLNNLKPTTPSRNLLMWFCGKYGLVLRTSLDSMSLLQSLKSEFLKPPDEGNLEVRRGDELLVKAKKRASVYDAVAGSINSVMVSAVY